MEQVTLSWKVSEFLNCLCGSASITSSEGMSNVLTFLKNQVLHLSRYMIWSPLTEAAIVAIYYSHSQQGPSKASLPVIVSTRSDGEGSPPEYTAVSCGDRLGINMKNAPPTPLRVNEPRKLREVMIIMQSTSYLRYHGVSSSMQWGNGISELRALLFSPPL